MPVKLAFVYAGLVTPSRQKFIIAGLMCLILVGLIGLGVVYRVRLDGLEGYYAPIYDSNGREIFYVHRSTTGISWGFGYEHFTAPAHVYVLRDRYELRRIDVATGDERVLKEWPSSPLEGRHLRHYRGRLYGLPRVRLQWGEKGELEHTIAVTLRATPRSKTLGLRRRWNNAIQEMEDTGTWQQGHFPVTGYSEDAIRENSELLTPRGDQHFPVAIVDYRPSGEPPRVIKGQTTLDKLFTEDELQASLNTQSRYDEVMRLRQIRDTQSRLIAGFKAQGLNDGQAFLRANMEMQRLGYYPKDDVIIARRLMGVERLAAENSPERLFHVAEREMQSGVFPDIATALAKPGTEVAKRMGRYLIHRDFSNSARLNKLIASGAEQFFIAYRDDVFELTITRF